jgi:hypothetical protein
MAALLLPPWGQAKVEDRRSSHIGLCNTRIITLRELLSVDSTRWCVSWWSPTCLQWNIFIQLNPVPLLNSSVRLIIFCELLSLLICSDFSEKHVNIYQACTMLHPRSIDSHRHGNPKFTRDCLQATAVAVTNQPSSTHCVDQFLVRSLTKLWGDVTLQSRD